MVTIREIARLAGVSPAAVSIAINNKSGIGDDTRKKIQDILSKEKYSRTYVKKTRKRICFIKYKKHGMLVDENQGFISSIVEGLEMGCKQHGIIMETVISNLGQKFSDLIAEIDFRNFDGAIILGTELDTDDYPYLHTISVPYTILDNPMINFPCACVSIDNKEVVYSALLHLKSRKHISLAYFKSAVSIPNFAARERAFFQYCEELGLSINDSMVFCLPPTLMGAYQEMKKLLSSKPSLPSAAFSDNDSIAIGAIKALLECGYRVPDDISVIGFDDIPYSAICEPPLTTMSIPKRQMGMQTISQVLQMIEDEPIVIKSFVSSIFIDRESTKELN